MEIRLSEMARNHFLIGGSIESWNRAIQRMINEKHEGQNDR